MNIPTRRRWIRLGFLTCFSAGIAFAQPAQPTIRTVAFYTVKSDRIADFLAATKEYAEAVKKGGGEGSFTLWSSLSGPREYALVNYSSKWADLDRRQREREPKLQSIDGQLTALGSRIMNTVESTRRVYYELDAELSLPLPADEPQAMARVLRTWVRPDQLGEYRALIKADVLPAMKKSGSKLFSVARVRYGGSNYEMSSVTGLDKWGDLDGEAPMVRAMGGRATYDKFVARLRPMITRSEYEMYRYLKDQSYIAPMK
ncbi:MAG: hypothetical protein HYX27_05580 [Acidobacteria bacterium]|nr:hypothetical protein [Acidobacteriota bacterium]